MISFLPFVHDFELLKGVKGFSGFSSLRIAVWVISMFLWGLSGWVIAFLKTKGKVYRFSLLAPILMGFFQLFIYVLDSRNSGINRFSNKVFLNIVIILIITAFYFKIKIDGEADK